MELKRIDFATTRWLGDGVYVVSPTSKVLEVDDQGWDDVSQAVWDVPPMAEEFIQNNPNWVIACAYQTWPLILLSERPMKFQGKRIGGGFSHGTTCVLKDIPQGMGILILGEDD